MEVPYLKVNYRRGFTIVELLIVIVIVAILAAISIVVYSGIQRRAHETALQHDISQAAKILALDLSRGSYPASVSAANDGGGLPSSGGSTKWQYTSDGTSYCLTGTSAKGDVAPFFISSSNGGTLQQGVCSGHIDNSGSENSTNVCNGLATVASDDFGGSGTLGSPWAPSPESFAMSGGSANSVSLGMPVYDQSARSESNVSCASIKLNSLASEGVGIVYRAGGPSYRAIVVAAPTETRAYLSAGPNSQTVALGGGWSAGDVMTVGLSSGNLSVHRNGVLIHEGSELWKKVGPTNLAIRFGIYSGGAGSSIDDFRIYTN